jgi:endothelin-converting enzyme/putative endopeptidase
MRPYVLALLPLVFSAVASAEGAAAGTLTPEQVRDGVLGSMDRTADPCQDFYRYACGGWLDSTKLPADQSRWVRSFSTITEHNRDVVRALLEDAARDPGPAGTERQKIGDLYGACMDEAALDKSGARPLAPLLARADSVTDPASLLRVTAELSRQGVDALIGAGPVPDFKNPTLNLYFLSQGGLGLPDRDYYVSEDPKKKEILAAYEKHVARMLGMIGEEATAAAADAGRIVGFEAELARASRPRAEMRDREKLYHKIDREGLEKLTPALPWAAYFEGLGHPDLRSINVAVPEFYQAVERLAAATPVETLRAYLRWQVLDDLAAYLPESFAVADYEFFGRTLSGQAEIQPRWKRCVGAVNGLLGEAVGKLYVEREFAGNSKQVALEMIQDVEHAFEGNLANLGWMDGVTRARAVEKARKVANKIGYPDTWRDYSTVAVRRDDYFGSAESAERFEAERQLAKVGRPVDRGEWLMTPQVVNAYYLATNNEIVFPAGILQPPFFHKDFPAAMNYGAVGAVMGHELTHGFDDQGRKSDGDGVLREWWEPAVAERFDQAAQCVEKQYSAREVEPGVHVDGKLTLGENIADLGGLKEAQLAYAGWRQRHGAPEPLVPGLTDDQLLFVSFAQTWCSLGTPEFLRRQVTTDSHSPGMFRAVAAPMNSPAFRAAFACQDGDRMVAHPTCTVW